MKSAQILSRVVSILALSALVSCTMPAGKSGTHAPGKSKATSAAAAATDKAQVPAWSDEDMDFFLHGSMGAEAIPETVLRAFIYTYPDLFPSLDLSHLGLIPDAEFGWPVGFSRANVPHLGGLSSVGLNCAACHAGEICISKGGVPVRVLGMTGQFDGEAFFNSVTIATFRTADPANMKKFLAAWLAANDPSGGDQAQKLFAAEWHRQEEKITAVVTSVSSRNMPPGVLLPISPSDLRLDHESLANGLDLAALAHSTLVLFHNIRSSLHVSDHLPSKAPPASGPGRSDAFGVLSAALFNAPQPYAPAKFGLVWNLEKRPWVNWDGNTRSPLERNLLASLGLGAPLVGKRAQIDLGLIKRQTDLSQTIRPPRYPFYVDDKSLRAGAGLYKAHCASCHEGPEGDARLHATAEIGTDPRRAETFTPTQADRFNKFLAELDLSGYQAPPEPAIRSTQQYWAPGLAGVWARSPYLHNGSVRTMQQLLTAPANRAAIFHRGSNVYDTAQMGYADDGIYVFDASEPGNSNAGHNFGTNLSDEQKRQLIEYLKTL
jgi:hypothetical protein